MLAAPPPLVFGCQPGRNSTLSYKKTTTPACKDEPFNLETAVDRFLPLDTPYEL